MSLIYLTEYVDTDFVLWIPSLVDLNGKHKPDAVPLDGEITAQFGATLDTPPSALLNKHGAAPLAGEFRTDMVNGMLKCTFTEAMNTHHHLRLKGTDANTEWLDFQWLYQLLYHYSEWDGTYERFYRKDLVTVVAHRVVQKVGTSTRKGPIITGDVPV